MPPRIGLTLRREIAVTCLDQAVSGKFVQKGQLHGGFGAEPLMKAVHATTGIRCPMGSFGPTRADVSRDVLLKKPQEVGD